VSLFAFRLLNHFVLTCFSSDWMYKLVGHFPHLLHI